MNALRLIPVPEKWAEAIRYGLLSVVLLDSVFIYEIHRSTQAVAYNMQNNVIEEQVFSDLKDAECGQRGFLYTDGNEQYLPQYYVGVENTKADMVILKQYLSGDKDAQPIVAELSKDVDLKLKELDSTVRAYRSGDPKKAKEIVESGAGVHQMETIRIIIGVLRARERDALRRNWFFF